MDRKLWLICLFAILAFAAGVIGSPLVDVAAESKPAQPPLGSAFTYQGRLTDGSSAADGTFSMTFRLYAAATGGGPLGSQTSAVTVTDGLFTALLDFGPAAFDGGSRWLELEVAGTTLAPRQQLTAAPYAIYAGGAPWSGLRDVPADLADGDDVGLTSVGWTDVLSRPAGLDDGDDDTTYTAGGGLTLNGTQFNIDGGAVQARVAGACAVGSSIRAIAADGTVTCATAEPRPGFASTHLDDPTFFGVAGRNSSATTGIDGLPVIAYRIDTGFTTPFTILRVARCNDIACTSARISDVDGSGVVGDQISIAIGSDGLPVISYYDQTNLDLKVAHCGDLECATSTTATLESGRQSGRYNAIAVNGDGLPIISYYDQTDTSLKVARCGDLACTSALTATLHDLDDTGKFTSIALGIDGLPVVSYYNQTESSLWVAHCANLACSSASTARIDNANDSGQYTSLAIGYDGMPIVAYRDATLADLKVAHCNDIACAAAAIATVDSTGSTGVNPSLAIAPDGLPVIAYYHAGLADLRVARCQSATCASSANISLDSVGNTGQEPSLTIGSDGLPIISYYYTFGKLLKVIHCSNPFCAPFGRAR